MSHHEHQFSSDASKRDRSVNCGRAGGIASGQSRRIKKQAREVAQEILSCHPKLSDHDIELLKTVGFKAKTVDVRIIAMSAIASKAMEGNLDCYKFLLETAGEYSAGKMELVSIQSATVETFQTLSDLINNPAPQRTIDDVLAE